MTHVLMRDTNPQSTSAGQEVRKAVTVVEAPPMKVLAIRGYHMTPYGMQTAGEVWANSEEGPSGLHPRFANQTRGERDQEEGRKPAKRAGRIPVRDGESNEEAFEALSGASLCEIRLIVSTQPSLVKSVPSKTPEIMEVGLVGGDNSEKIEWAKERLGGEITIADVYDSGQEIDVVGITKGKGFQGVVKRFGVKLLLSLIHI